MTDKKRTATLDWEDIRFFTALARHGTLASAARSLKVTHATVARRLANFEATLGRPVFNRGLQGFTLNAAGAAALAEAAQMEMAACALAERRENAGAIVGLVRITLARVLADGFLAEQLVPLQVKYPQLDIELVATSKNLSLARREAEIALRLARPAAGDLLARRLATLDYGFYAAPDFAARVASGEEPGFIAFDDASEHVPEAAWARRFLSGRRVMLRANSQLSQALAARAGRGVALLPGLLARTLGGLVAVPFDETPPSRELWLLLRPDVARLARVRAVADFLVEVFHEHRG
ncbi:MAG TPA: LysR family transcriptional regulator [Steroidobacteraceae bacterium]|jgi:DNA-binding transcriptional LysR family regulator|nr:LysR family transcriptional regulator [Steroidobacteraceae bacterium]